MSRYERQAKEHTKQRDKKLNGAVKIFPKSVTSFLFVLILNPLIPKLRQSKSIGAILDSINVGAVALIIAVCVEMGKDTLTDWRTIIIVVASLIVVFVFKKMNNAFIVLGGAIIGYLLTLI